MVFFSFNTATSSTLGKNTEAFERKSGNLDLLSGALERGGANDAAALPQPHRLLFSAVKSSDFEALKTLEMFPFARDKVNRTLLMVAAMNANTEILNYLILNKCLYNDVTTAGSLLSEVSHFYFCNRKDCTDDGLHWRASGKCCCIG